LLLRYPRWIHAEQRTHRLIPLDEGLSFFEPTPSLMADPNLSRNAASSRAIPVDKLIADVEADPAFPLYWGKNIGGMQAKEELTGWQLDAAKSIWEAAMHDAIRRAKELANLGRDEDCKIVGAHKQIVNRLLEPFSHITVLVSATEWGNFLELRDHGDAEPHIQMLAQEIRKCLERTDDIQDLEPGEWHMPFVEIASDKIDDEWKAADYLGFIRKAEGGSEVFGEVGGITPEQDRAVERALIKLSTARCASTSYKTVDGFDMTLERAIALHDKLVVADPIHASPAEHVAQADEPQKRREPGHELWWHGYEHGNFVGFRQYRHQL
jgi:hypothetical protein